MYFICNNKISGLLLVLFVFLFKWFNFSRFFGVILLNIVIVEIFFVFFVLVYFIVLDVIIRNLLWYNC